MRLACSSAWLFLACGLMARADVNYDVIQSAKWPPALIDSTVPWTNTGLFAISPKFYAPVLEGTAQEVIHVHIKDHKLLAVGSKICRIYDLDAVTVTTVDLEAGTYSVESLDAAYEQYRHAASHNTDRDLGISVRKTGKRVHLYDQDATEYELVAIRKPFGRRKITVRSLCWIADHAPSAELDEFRKNWSARTNLHFLVESLLSNTAGDAYVAMVRAQASIPGYVLGFVTEAKSAESRLGLEGRPSSVYDARYYHLPNVQSSENARDSWPQLQYDPLVYPLGANRLIQINLLNFTNNAIAADAFGIPSRFKQRESPVRLLSH
jgi:hypothetical protein